MIRLLDTPDFSQYTTSVGDAPDDPEQAIEIQYLGTAGFVIRGLQRTLVLDPYLTRPNLRTTLFKPLVSNSALIHRYIPHCDEVFIGHAHHDHILDAPELCLQTGARLIGSSATAMVGRAAGLPEHQLHETHGHEPIACGAWVARAIPALHGKVIFNQVLLSGDIPCPPPWPPRFYHLRQGQVFNWVLHSARLTIIHIDTADFYNHELQGITADVLCLCAIGRKYRPNYVRDAVNLLKPRYIIPCHWDTMLTPLEAPPQLIPGVALHQFVEEIRHAGVEPVVLPLLGKAWF